MRFKFVFVILFLFALIFSACSGVGEDTSLEDSSWQLIHIDNQTIPSGANVTINFQDGQASGVAACNQYGGAYTYSPDGDFTLSQMMMTLMACLDNDLMELESAYLQVLGGVNFAKVDGDQLILTGEFGELIFELVSK